MYVDSVARKRDEKIRRAIALLIDCPWYPYRVRTKHVKFLTGLYDVRVLEIQNILKED